MPSGVRHGDMEWRTRDCQAKRRTRASGAENPGSIVVTAIISGPLVYAQSPLPNTASTPSRY